MLWFIRETIALLADLGVVLFFAIIAAVVWQILGPRRA